MNARKLSELAAGARARITRVTLPGGTRQRLLEMGMTPGAEFELVRFAPMGDPMEIRLRGYHLSLRRLEAEGIEVEEVTS